MNNDNMAEAARIEKQKYLRDIFEKQDVSYPPCNIFIRVFKKERMLELWGRNENNRVFDLIKTYGITCSSGELGPKRREGDRQVPEGFYYVNAFNHRSKYYLSLGIDYPNQSDLILGDSISPGSDIFIHGGQKSVGCIPIGDEGIKEVYTAAFDSMNASGEKIQVHIFPGRIDESFFKDDFINSSSHKEFWGNIREGYSIFERTHSLPEIFVDASGRYVFRELKTT
jgi:Uncharacterized protein conserved in bacteria